VQLLFVSFGVVALRQIDFPAVPASISVLDLNYFYLHGAVPSAVISVVSNTMNELVAVLEDVTQHGHHSNYQKDSLLD
jgi:predicted membrane metal-binding protein